MPGEQDASNEAVLKATGKSWDAWFKVMDGLGGDNHTDRVKRLSAAHPDVSSWWCQSITVEFERARGLRKRHETTDGFQGSAQRTIPLAPDDAFDALLANLPGDSRQWIEGETMDIEPGATIQVRAVRPPSLLRFWWTEDGSRSTVTVDLVEKSTGIAIRFQVSGAASKDAMEEGRKRWRAVLELLKAEA